MREGFIGRRIQPRKPTRSAATQSDTATPMQLSFGTALDVWLSTVQAVGVGGGEGLRRIALAGESRGVAAVAVASPARDWQTSNAPIVGGRSTASTQPQTEGGQRVGIGPHWRVSSGGPVNPVNDIVGTNPHVKDSKRFLFSTCK